MVQWIDPLTDPRWLDLTNRHPSASVFHNPGWLQALERTYGYRPVALASVNRQGGLGCAMVFCRVASRLTGRRLVSLPFTDHCDTLAEAQADHESLLDALRFEQDRGGWNYVEWRPRGRETPGLFGVPLAGCYWLHRLDLSGDSTSLLRSFHRNHVLRKIRRGRREKLVCEEGRSKALLDAFYGLFVKTRRRHGLPPQPYRWFVNILDCLSDAARVRVAFKDQTPIAAILTLQDRHAMTFKYGASDSRFHALGGTQLLLWKTIQDAREQGCTTLDFGRSNVENAGLVAFKEHWGATRSPLSYWRHPAPRSTVLRLQQSAVALSRRALVAAPDWLLVWAGRLLYRHVG